MRYWLDTEFIEDGKTIDLISIGIVAEDGREYYAISTDFNPKKASRWVEENVLSTLPPQYPSQKELIAIEVLSFIKQVDLGDDYKRLARSPFELWIARGSGVAGFYNHPRPEIRDLFDAPMDSKPEFWAYYSSYDWVAFCQLFGTMMDLPKGFPMYCRDIKQECDRLGNPKLPEQTVGEHNALYDARWNRKAWDFLQSLGDNQCSLPSLDLA
jgi:hypothetical protein